MANLLIDSVRDALTSGAIVNGAASALGISPAAASKALAAGGSTVLAALAGKARDPAAVDELYTMVQDPALASTAIEDPTRLLGTAPEAARARDLGDRLVSGLFGNRTTDMLGALSRHAGISTTAASSLMSVAAPLVMRALGGVVRSGGLTVATLAQTLTENQSELVHAVPDPLANFVSKAQIYDAVGESRPRPPPPSSPEIVEPRQRSWWALPLAVVPLLLLAIWFVRGRRDEPRPMSDRTATDATVSARPNTPPPARPEAETPSEAALPAPGGAAPPAVASPPETPSAAPAGAGKQATRTVRVPEIDREIQVAEDGVEMRLLAFLRDRNARPDEDTWYEFDRLVFESEGATLAAGSNEQLENLAAILAAFPNARIKVGGYTDNTGDPEYNRKLSQERADAVKRELVRRGIAAERIETEGYGEAHPVASNATEEGRAKNRRVALRVLQLTS